MKSNFLRRKRNLEQKDFPLLEAEFIMTIVLL